MDQVEIDYECYVRLVELWSRENGIKTTKLQTLLAVNAVLAAAVAFLGRLGPRSLPLFLGGALASLVWLFSIGRTVLFQKVWQNRLARLAARHPADPRFQILETTVAEAEIDGWLRAFGALSSKYYLLGAPLVFCAAWIGGAIWVLGQGR